uniref:J domain-containing protein n=1 Tax=Schlesneria paludicola TaxID=360056 RepID=A0A7C4QKX3_9PLAN
MRMPFGKYRGQPLSEIPQHYLEWLLRSVDLRPSLEAAVIAELNQRYKPPPPPIDLKAVTKAWYRQLTLKYHPDRGGSNAAMAAINDAYDVLRELLARNGVELDA